MKVWGGRVFVEGGANFAYRFAAREVPSEAIGLGEHERAICLLLSEYTSTPEPKNDIKPTITKENTQISAGISIH